MTATTLPTELLIKICSAVSSPSDLYHLLQALKQLASVVRPFLYHHIIIRTKRQRQKLKNVREVDKKLVRKVTISGDGPIEISKMTEHFESEDGCKLGGGCLADLYEGKILDISTIEVLHVINVHEDPRLAHNIREEKDGFTVSKPARSLTASSLVEVQILGHQGGAYHWKTLFPTSRSPAVHPACLRLAYTAISFYGLPASDLRSSSRSPQSMSLGLSDSTDQAVAFMTQLELEVCTVGFSLGGPFAQRGGLGHLIHISTTQLRESVANNSFGYDILRRHQIWIDGDASTLNAVLSEHPDSNLSSLAGVKPRFLLLPAGARNVFEEYNMDCSNLEVHYYTPEERNSFLLIPPQFIDYVERIKRLEPKEAKAGAVWRVWNGKTSGEGEELRQHERCVRRGKGICTSKK